MADCHGRALLRRFLDRHGVSQRVAACAIGVSAPTMSDWLSGNKRPTDHMRTAIAKWTRGAVPEGAWMFADEARALEAVKAFRATGT